ncbi:50S ribosomal protein L13 [Candidatus Shikimatogenerans silvanidophilus]|uniref:50S ribosomal protein L13 n=1 Tax=Candidatus Shikimatogenerans silvanidophilus TaxID=2782547 RepID=UPI001BADB0D7|nr:50S ribosomal protein L13 [Candidatus Shikimatogenerans silvanidophilus]
MKKIFKTLFYSEKKIKKKWFIIDAKNKILGRLSSIVSNIITGKNKPNYSPNINCGDKVIIINSKKIKISGKKKEKKIYIRYTGYPGGKKIYTFKELIKKNPNKIIENSIKRMLPKNRLGRKIYKKNLYVYSGKEHKHKSQNIEFFYF